ncbi:MAG: TOBE domain-containing protein [Acidobacteriaceae bacterium]|jgi:molybdate transport system regulatory protein
MRISARNVLAGQVERVVKGAVNAEVDLRLVGGEKIAAVITNASVDALKLSAGGTALAIIKASNVMVGKGLEGARLSARNVLDGTVSGIQEGAVNSEVTIRLPGGTAVVASITRASVAALALQPGDAVSAIIKASNVMVGVDN